MEREQICLPSTTLTQSDHSNDNAAAPVRDDGHHACWFAVVGRGLDMSVDFRTFYYQARGTQAVVACIGIRVAESD
jgi:hypothetical protein